MKFPTILLLALLLPISLPAREFSWQASVEAGNPQGPSDFRSGYEPSGGAGLGLGLEAAPHIEALLDVAYHNFPIKRSYFFGLAGFPDDGTSTLNGGQTTALMALFNMRIRPLKRNSWIQPTICAGMGLCGFTVHETKAETPLWILDVPVWKENDMAARLTGGVEVRWCRGVNVFLEAGEVFIATTGDATRLVLVRWGLRFTPDVFRRNAPKNSSPGRKAGL